MQKKSNADILYKTLFEQSPYGVLVIDPDGRFLDFNEAAHRELGYTREEFAGLRLADIDPVQSPVEIKKHIDELATKGKAEFEVKHRAKNGDIRDVHVITQALNVADRTIFHTIWRDITEHTRTEKAKAESDKRFHALFDNMPLGIVIVSTDRRIIDCNTAFQNMLGYSAGELQRLTIPDISHAGDDLATRGHYEAMVSGAINSFTMEKRHVRKDGTIIWTNLTGTVIRDEKHSPQLLFGIVEDITERKKSEDTLRLSEARLRVAQQIAHVGNWDWDLSTNQVFWSDELYRIYGYQPREIAPDYGLVVAALRPDSRSAFLKAVAAALKGEGAFEMDYTFFRKDGSPAVLHTIGKVKCDSGGKAVWMSGIVQDVTENRRAAESLLLFRTLLNQTNDAIFVNDPKTGRFLIVNDRACVNLGYDRSALLGLSTMDIETIFADPAMWEAHVRELKNRGHMILEGVHKRSDGTALPVEVSVTYLAIGARDYMVAVARDITERKSAERALRASEERLAKAQQIAHVGNWELDLVENKLFWSDEVYRIYGRSPRDFAPTFEEVEKAMHPEDREPFLKAVNAAIYERQPFEMDYRLIRPDGTERIVHTIGEVVYDALGKPLVKNGTVQDVTRLKKAEEALRSSKDFIERILDSVDEAFIVIDRDYRIVRANSAYGVQAGRAIQEIIGKHCYEISHQRSRPCDEA